MWFIENKALEMLAKDPIQPGNSMINVKEYFISNLILI